MGAGEVVHRALTVKSREIDTACSGRAPATAVFVERRRPKSGRTGEILPPDRQHAQPLAGGSKDRVGHGGLNHGCTGLADAAPFLARRGRDVDFGLGRVLEAHDRIGIEVALLDPAVLHRDLAEQRGRKPVDHAAFELCLDPARVDDDTAVARDHDALDFHLAVNHRNLGNHADHEIIAFVNSDATAFAFRHRLAPVALFDQHVEHPLEVGAVGQQFAPERDRVLAGRVRHLVDEALHEEHVLGVARRAPWAERHVRILQDRGHAVVWKRVGRIDQALHRLRIEAIAHGLQDSSCPPSCACRAQSALPSAANPALKRIAACGAVAAMANFLFARPDELDRLADRLGRPRPPARPRRDPAAGRSRRLKTCCGCSTFSGFTPEACAAKCQGEVRVLGADPHVDAIGLHMRDGVERLHRARAR